MHLQIEAKVNEILQALRDELKKSNVIDANGNATDLKKFESIVKSKLNELRKMEKSVVDTNGVAIDRYGTNIWMRAVSQTQEVLDCKSLNPQQNHLNNLTDVAINRLETPSIFKRITGKLLGFRIR